MSESMNIAVEETVLNIPYEERMDAIRVAGKLKSGENALYFDDKKKVWKARIGTNLDALDKWLIKDFSNIDTPSISIDQLEQQFADWLTEQGAVLNGPPIMDGKNHPVDVIDSKRGSKKGVYRAYVDGMPNGWFRNYKTSDDIVKWHPGLSISDPHNVASLRAAAAVKLEKREAEKKALQNKTALQAQEKISTLALSTGNEPYLVKKGVKAPSNVYADENGTLYVPLQNVLGEIRSYETINAEGVKSLLSNGEMWGNYAVIGGSLTDGKPIQYAEGLATAQSIYEATNKPVVCTINAGNMVQVAKNLKEAYPNSNHYFYADNDIYKESNAGLNYANQASEITDGRVFIPKFSHPDESLTDFNDLHVNEGIDALKSQLSVVFRNIEEKSTMNSPENKPSVTADEYASYVQYEQLATDSEMQQILEETGSDQSVQLATEVPPAAPAVTPEVDIGAVVNEMTSIDENLLNNSHASTIDSSIQSPVKANAMPSEDGKQTYEVPIATKKASGDVEPYSLADQQIKKKTQADPNGIAWVNRNLGQEGPKERIDLDSLLKRISYREDKGYVTYMVSDVDAFNDYGSHMLMANDEASKNDEMILAAIKTALAQHKNGIEITGSDKFKAKALQLMAEYGIEAKLNDPKQRADLLSLKNNFSEARTQNSQTMTQSKVSRMEGKTNPQEYKQNNNKSLNGVQFTQSTGRELSEESTTPKGIFGTLVDYGSDNFRHKDGESKSFFIKVQNSEGVKEYWGVDLQRAIHDAGVKRGDIITAEKLGKKDITVDAPVRNDEGAIVRYEKINSKRVEWSVKNEYPVPTATNPEASSPSELVPYDAKTFNKLRDKLTNDYNIDLSHEVLPKNDIYWFKKNGKPASEDLTKPAELKLSDESKNSGVPLLIDNKKNPSYILLETRKGFLQGVVKEPESGNYHSVIGKINERIHKGIIKQYITLSVVNANNPNGMSYHGYGNAAKDGNGLVYKNVFNQQNETIRLQPFSDDVKNKVEMKRILNVKNSVNEGENDRKEYSHAPSHRQSPRM